MTGETKKQNLFGGFRRRRQARRERMLTMQEEYFRKNFENIRDPKRQKRPHTPKQWLIFGALVFNGGIVVAFSAAYGIMEAVFRTWFPHVGYPLWRQYLTILVTVQLLGVIFMGVRLIFDPGRHQIKTFVLMMDAMQRMAKGDFNVNLAFDHRQAGQIGALVKSFNEMATELSQMENMRQEFISNVSHEFQSPLTSIGGFARALQADDLTEENRRHYLRIITMETARLSKLSDNLLKLTSLESNHHPFEPKAYRLDRQLRSVIIASEPQWQEKQLQWDVDLPETTITADEELLNQVWINLLHNAVKFTPEGGTIRIKLEERDGLVRTEVSDTGIGVVPEDLPHLFERFFKADKARSRTGGGSGLGLSMVRKIVDMHDGEVTVSSRPGEGTTFVVTLPKETAAPLASTVQAGREILQHIP